MADPIEFFFDFSSPYGYLGAQEIDRIGARHGREVAWKPYLMGATFKTTGTRPLRTASAVKREGASIAITASNCNRWF